MFYQLGDITINRYKFFFIILFCITLTCCNSYINVEGSIRKLPKYVLKYSQEDYALIEDVMQSLLSDIETVVLEQLCLGITEQEVIHLNRYLVGCVTTKNDSIILASTISEIENDFYNEKKWPVFEELQDNIIINKSFPYNMVDKFYVYVNVHDTIIYYQLKNDKGRFDFERE